MAIDQTAGAAPIVLGLPLITTDADVAGDIVCSDATMQALRNRLYQLDPSAPCASVASAGIETIVAGFWVGSSQMSKTFDCLFILNTNLKRFVIQYSNDNGVTYYTVPGTDYAAVDFVGTDFILFLTTPLTANKIRLSMSDLSQVDKSLGTFNAALTTFQSARQLSKLNTKSLQTRKDIGLADGTSDQTYFEWSDNSYTLTEIDSEFEFVATAGKALWDTLFQQLSPFLYYPEPGDATRGIYLVSLKINTYNATYFSEWKGRGYRIRFTAQPLGYV